MQLITLDSETYFDKEYSLKKMTTEAYVRDPRFEVLCMETDCRLPSAIEDIPSNAVLCHHAQFDGLILSHHYNIRPKFWFDTLSMARIVFPHWKSHSLASLAKYFGLADKSVPYEEFKGKRRADMSEELMQKLRTGCRHDVELTRTIFDHLLPYVPKSELKLIDLTIRMFTEPVLQLDRPRLEAYSKKITEEQNELLDRVGVTKESLRSADKFAALLEDFGIEPPKKISPRTKKETYAFAKTDPGMVDLLNHEYEEIRTLAEARLSSKSTLGETRAGRLLSMGERGPLSIYLKYYGAHTGRWSGGDSLNFQNFPRGGELRKSLIAPEGYVLCVADLAQIECRMLNWMAGQEWVIDAFRENRDLYCEMASSFYGREITKADKVERFFGNTLELGCLGPDTLVLTDRGIVPIVQVKVTDKVWDGEEWVNHLGLVPQGVKEVITHEGITATLDHEILTEHGWEEWSEVCGASQKFRSAIKKASLLSYVMNRTRLKVESVWDGTRLLNVAAGGKGTLIGLIYRKVEQRAVILVLKLNQLIREKLIGVTRAFYQTLNIGVGYLTGSRAVLVAAITGGVRPISIMGYAVLKFTSLGVLIGESFLNIYWGLKAGIIQKTTLIGSIMIRVMNQVISDLSADRIICGTVGVSRNSKEKSIHLKKKSQTYDLAHAGRNNRFTVISNKGPIIVHNCGYGIGWKKLQGVLKLNKLVLSESEAKKAIHVYRSRHDKVESLWEKADWVLGRIYHDSQELFNWGPMKVLGREIEMPNGSIMDYTNINRDRDGFFLDLPKGRTKIYGGKLVENVVQALSRIVMAEAMQKISDRYRLVVTCHDEIVYLAKHNEADEALAYGLNVMKTPPVWATDLPLSAEGGYAKEYSK